ncbi:CRISPR-associated helicase Cas3' [Cutibacterium sp. WCA-380-WT-3A]|uniref:CRISPR-associated helicase Cas3 n=1 Tax=Cutibacterium porci TaxID=2605781 RepID=A0A7K0J8X2_9ACTN|nr:CRISPR-associated helicase Cas3' [Cutibacterium porci]MSS46396.1 CRISPR-associated helicase Cas3' [Cutibacterium porci]
MLNTWSPPAQSCWGKTNESGGWLPVVQHLEDAAGIMAEVWRLQPQSIRSLLADTLGGERAAQTFVCFLAGIHDVGKISADFAYKARFPRPDGTSTSYLCDQMERHGFVITKPEHPIPHGAVGQCHTQAWLLNRYPDVPRARRCARNIASIVGGHHGMNPTDGDVKEYGLSLAREDHLWKATRDEVLNTMAAHTGAEEYLPKWMSTSIPIQVQVLSEALVIMADWIASSESLFPYDVTEQTPDRVRRAATRLHLPHPWQLPPASNDAADIFRRSFPSIPGGAPNAMQASAVEAAEAMTEPGLLVIEAPMGQGKTEAALMCAEVLARKFGLGGVFFGLPTMATSNPMFGRVREWLDAVPATESSSISLAHSKAGLNEEYQQLMPWNAHMDVYDDSAGTQREASAIVHEWFLGRKRAILADHVVGTIDQALFTGLKAKHVVLRHLGLASKVVIIDEVHAADVYMREYLKVVLEWLGAYRTPVILMSATLPPAQRHELALAYAKGRHGRNAQVVLTTTDEYPIVTTVSDGVAQQGTSTSAPGRQIVVRSMGDSLDELISLIEDKMADGGCIGIIRDTVSRAQETFDALESRLDCEVVLVHSRFLAPQRARREADLVRRLGRSGGDRPHRIVVVGTQVLEQSLDVDFDLLVSDIAPMDLLLQRIGRLHRHDRQRPVSLREATCLVTGIDDWRDDGPAFSRGVDSVYGEDALLRTAALLNNLPGGTATVPADIPRLVREAYSEPFTWPTKWAARGDEASMKARSEHGEAENRAKTFRLAHPYVASSLMKGLTDVSTLDPENSSGHARVRDSEDSIEVIVIQESGSGGHRLPSGIGEFSGAELPLFGAPEGALARAVASCTVSLPRSVSNPWDIDQTIAELEAAPIDLSSWQTSPWLRGQLVLVLDAEGNSTLLGRPIHYDSKRGLTVEPRLDKGDPA